MARSLLAASVLMVSFLLPARVSATAGFAEWEVLTPGGHTIAHSDRWKSEHGDCLVPAGASKPVVSRIQRWRYYKGKVAGQTKGAWFLFDEKSQRATAHASEAALEAAIKSLGLGQPLSDWYTPDLGWSETWFPLMVWRYCTPPGPSPKLPPLPPEIEKTYRKVYKPTCDRFLSASGLALARLTTWGQQCTKAAREKTALESPLDAWCKLVLGPAAKKRP